MTAVPVPVRSPMAVLRDAVRGPGAGWRIAAAAALTVTVAAQHPGDLFGRIREKDPLALIPNWRFFAPNPSVHDSEFCYRTLSEQGETSPWTALSLVPERTLRHMVWFPDRRVGKAVFDVGSDIVRVIAQGFPAAERLPSYRLLVGFLRRRIHEAGGGTTGDRVKGFQFAYARTAGYDTSEEAEWLFISPYIPMDPTGAAARATGPVHRPGRPSRPSRPSRSSRPGGSHDRH
ncbi:hypothetical protein ABT354_22245 [Streptomyces sp. NPDC000594]|uniref:hypothetical protein n=1 Tax=Streptomyces sp. NPDC000594 TaxID=3154261 RepID=UPI00332230E6